MPGWADAGGESDSKNHPIQTNTIPIQKNTASDVGRESDSKKHHSDAIRFKNHSDSQKHHSDAKETPHHTLGDNPIDSIRVFEPEKGGFSGQISRFRYYSRPLQPNDVVELYNDGPF